jgi:hypothetical protein
MHTGSATIRITTRSRETVRELAREMGLQQQEVLDLAVEAYRRKVFLRDANTAFAALRDNPAAWGAEQEERAAWDAAVGDGVERDA